jgi:hypothetical protein
LVQSLTTSLLLRARGIADVYLSVILLGIRTCRLTALTLSIDDVAVTSDHVTCAIGVELWDGSLLISIVSTVMMERGTHGKTLEGKGHTVSESSDGALCQILDNVGNRVLLGREEFVDFLECAILSAKCVDGTKARHTT